MKNGYALASLEGLVEINSKIKLATEAEIDALRKLLRIGVQWNTQVTWVVQNTTFHRFFAQPCQLRILNNHQSFGLVLRESS